MAKPGEWRSIGQVLAPFAPSQGLRLELFVNSPENEASLRALLRHVFPLIGLK